MLLVFTHALINIRFYKLINYLTITYLRLKDKVRIIFDCSDHNNTW